MVKTNEEVSVVCSSDFKLKSCNKEKDWSVIKVIGPLDFSLTGILSKIANAIADEKISIFAMSIFDTDYFLMKT